MYIKGDNKKEQEHFNYLEELCQSGVTNMFAAAPYLREAYPEDFEVKRGFHDKPCAAVLVKWIQRHNDTAYHLEKPK